MAWNAGTTIMAAIYLAVLIRICESIAKVLYAEWTKPGRNRIKEAMDRLREAARRDGSYVELSPEHERWKEQGYQQ